MRLQTTSSRFLFGAACAVLFILIGFLIVGALIPTWNATRAEIEMNLPGDDLIAQPQTSWNHALTIHAPADQIYPWLIQMGDSRAAYYSFTFIENLFMISAGTSDRYVNASTIHPEWQEPPIGQGMIITYLVMKDYQAGEYVLAANSEELPGMQWTWLWYLQPVDQNTTRLIVRHRFAFPKEAPTGLFTAVLNAGYVMERGMMLGIRERAEGRIPSGFNEPLQIILWLVALACGIVAAVRFVRQRLQFDLLGIGLAVILLLFIYTFVQPAIWLRILLDLGLIASLVVSHRNRR